MDPIDNEWEIEILANDRFLKHGFKKPATWFRVDVSLLNSAKWRQLKPAAKILWLHILSTGASTGKTVLRLGNSRVVALSVQCRDSIATASLFRLSDLQWIRILRSPTNVRTNGRLRTNENKVERHNASQFFEKSFDPKVREVADMLKPMYRNLPLPSKIRASIPKIISACDDDVGVVREALTDLYQSEKIATGNGITGSHSSYLTKALIERFGLEEQ